MDEINNIAESLKTETSPLVLVDYLTKLAGYASYYEGLLTPIQLIKPERWLAIQHNSIINWETHEKIKREKPLSDKKTEMTWATTEDGQKEIQYISKLKQIALMTSAIRQNLWAKRIEYKNLNPYI